MHGQDLQPTPLDPPSKPHLESSFGQVVFSAFPRPPSIYLRPATIIGSGQGSFQLDAESISRLDRFYRRTVYTFAGNNNYAIYQNHVTSIAIEVGLRYTILATISGSFHIVVTDPDNQYLQNPFLMHVILTLTATHDRILSASKDNAKRSIAEAYHWSEGAALLNKKLSSPIRPQDRDALWAAAAILGL